MTKPRGYILYEGLSPLDNQPIVVIAIKHSTNSKTGDMIQVYILKSDIHPIEAINTGEDYSICGNCKHRGEYSKELNKWINRSCYVNVGQGPAAVYKAYKKDSYPLIDQFSDSIFIGRSVRWGSYGDPALIPLEIVNKYNKIALNHTGYTHQWERFSEYAGIFQASCETELERLNAQQKGYRTFSVVAINNKAPNYAIQCPATRENSSVQCSTCTLCDGNQRDIFVVAHGKGRNYVLN